MHRLELQHPIGAFFLTKYLTIDQSLLGIPEGYD
ncbi:hypothetical protein SAMN05444394_3582 [Algoriphagus halophilus]|uniref:Uncharacterized protein n=1 Tax=Algoriphagus halophilus TaxID=226505 RepID=A0A1N6H5Y8_9BACT|nr:hypothetical protein SAMN05444394_3582 [Algoriphagus halophilus]